MKKIKIITLFFWKLITNNIKFIIGWGLMYYFFPIITTIIFVLIGIPFIYLIISAFQTLIVCKKMVLDDRMSIKDAYQVRHEMAERYFKINKLAKIIFINTIEGEYRKETGTTKDNISEARELLEIQKVFNERDVKKAWKDRLKENHPDLAPDHLKFQANKKTREINEAKDTLIIYLKDNGIFSKFNFK